MLDRAVSVSLTMRELEFLLLALDPYYLKQRIHPNDYDAVGDLEDKIGEGLQRSRGPAWLGTRYAHTSSGEPS